MSLIKRCTMACIAVACACILAFSLVACNKEAEVDQLVGTWQAVGISSKGFDHITYSSSTGGEIVLTENHTFEIHMGDAGYSVLTGTWSRDTNDETLYHLNEEDTTWSAIVNQTDHGSYLFLNNVDHDEIVLVYALDDEALASIDEFAQNESELDESGNLQPALTDAFRGTTGNQSGKPSPKNESLAAIENYLEAEPFSRLSLIEKLEADGLPSATIENTIDNCNINWNSQAVRMAQQMLDIQSMTHQELVAALEYKGFTPEEAQYGADNCGQALQ